MNQGDKLEHDFTCVLTVLMFPIRHICQQPLTDVTASATTHCTEATPLVQLLQRCQPSRIRRETPVFKRHLRPLIWQDLSPIFTFYPRCVRRRPPHAHWLGFNACISLIGILACCLSDCWLLLMLGEAARSCCLTANHTPVSYTHLTLPTNREV